MLSWFPLGTGILICFWLKFGAIQTKAHPLGWCKSGVDDVTGSRSLLPSNLECHIKGKKTTVDAAQTLVQTSKLSLRVVNMTPLKAR